MLHSFMDWRLFSIFNKIPNEKRFYQENGTSLSQSLFNRHFSTKIEFSLISDVSSRRAKLDFHGFLLDTILSPEMVLHQFNEKAQEERKR